MPQQTVTFTLSFPVNSLIQVTTNSLPAGVVGQPYSFQLQAAGGVSPYTWVGSVVPPGMTLSPSGLFSGTPTQAGNNNLSGSVSDAG